MIIFLSFAVALCTAIICTAIFLVGYVLGSKNKSFAPRKAEDTARQDREARIKQIEMQNFWSYNGDVQQDPTERSL
ncbi:MAG: hypothetical protein IJF58_04230 [Clostridia bacterium]|nr:hypothetical protein [Clostridia bacterium]